MARYVVDTHALLLFLAGSRSLGKIAAAAMSDPASELILPAIALAEALWILTARDLGVGPEDLVAAIDADPRITVVPLTREIVVAAHGLATISEMHDRQIVATALNLADPQTTPTLLTKDANIASSGLVPTAW